VIGVALTVGVGLTVIDAELVLEQPAAVDADTENVVV
jgi:hypothetical protein